MEKIAWTDSLSIGVEEIDSEHRLIINDLILILKAHKEGNKIGVTRSLSKLNNDISTHFKNEEFLMENLKYPDIDKHKLIHREFAEELKRIEYEALTIKCINLFEITDFVKKWLMDHAVYADLCIKMHIDSLKSKSKYTSTQAAIPAMPRADEPKTPTLRPVCP